MVSEPGSSAPAHWPDMARQWSLVGPPLRPSPDDVAFCREILARWQHGDAGLRALILGVTPELWHLPWPAGADVLAVDNTPEMIEHVWQGPREAVLCASWTQLPLETASRNLALCDGGLHLLPYPAAQQALVSNLRRVIRPGGLCVFRLFLPPLPRETPDAVLEDLLAGKVSSLNVLKLRLGWALVGAPDEGVELRCIWDALVRVAPDLPELAHRIGWPVDHLLAINTYSSSQARYYFADLPVVRDLFCREPGGFEVESIRVGSYELGERCPTLVLRRNQD